MSRVVVTGASGRLGGYVVDELATAYQVTATDLTPDRGHLALDVMDLAAVTDAVRGADTVVHLAALDYDTHAPDADFVRVNTLGTWHVLQACTTAGVGRVIVCSSVAALGLHERRRGWEPGRLPVDETHPARPAEAYSVSKLVVETMAQSFVYRGALDVLCLRPAAIVFDEAVDTFLQTVDGSVPSLFDYVTARDVACAVRAAVAAPWSGYECLLLCAADTAHLRPTLEWYERLVGSLPADVDHELFADNPRASVFSHRRATSVLDWRPTSDFTDLRPRR